MSYMAPFSTYGCSHRCSNSFVENRLLRHMMGGTHSQDGCGRSARRVDKRAVRVGGGSRHRDDRSHDLAKVAAEVRQRRCGGIVRCGGLSNRIGGAGAREGSELDIQVPAPFASVGKEYVPFIFAGWRGTWKLCSQYDSR